MSQRMRHWEIGNAEVGLVEWKWDEMVMVKENTEMSLSQKSFRMGKEPHISIQTTQLLRDSTNCLSELTFALSAELIR